MYNYIYTLSLFVLLLVSSVAFAQKPVAHFTVDCKTLCLNGGTGIGHNKVTLTYDGTTDTTYVIWSFPTGTTTDTTGVNPFVVTFDTAGTVVVRVTAINKYGESTFRDTIVITDKCSANFSISSGSTICKGDCVSFMDESNFQPIGWEWTFDTVGVPMVSTQQNPPYECFNTAGTFQFKLKAFNSCLFQDSITKQVSVIDCSQPGKCSIAYTLNKDTVPHQWNLLYTANGKQPITYTWNWGDGKTDTGSTATHTYDSAGYYTICATLVDDSGCTSTYCDTSTYMYRMENKNNTLLTVSVRNSATAAGVPLINDRKLSIYPNPAGDRLLVTGYLLLASNIQVSNILGSRVLVQKAKGKENSIDVSKLTPGVYFLSIEYADGASEVRKFVKE